MLFSLELVLNDHLFKVAMTRLENLEYFAKFLEFVIGNPW